MTRRAPDAVTAGTGTGAGTGLVAGGETGAAAARTAGAVPALEPGTTIIRSNCDPSPGAVVRLTATYPPAERRTMSIASRSGTPSRTSDTGPPETRSALTICVRPT